MKIFKTPITSKVRAMFFLNKLDTEGKLFHPDDDPREIIDSSNVRLFNDEDCLLLDKRMEEIHTHLPDPCSYIIEEIYANRELIDN